MPSNFRFWRLRLEVNVFIIFAKNSLFRKFQIEFCNENFTKMVRTKNNFRPLVAVCGGSGETLNEEISDGVVVVSANSEKITLDTLQKMDKLEQQTPFDMSIIPDKLTE